MNTINATPSTKPTPQNLDLKRIFTALQEARTKLEAVNAAQHEPIAIVGMSGRFPGANNVEEFWQNLQAGRSGIRELTDAELAASGVSPELWQQPNYVRAYASPDDIAGFDAELFGYAPREVELIDPQHRLFLECAWEALEHSGHDAEQFAGTIAVYGGASMNGYLINLHSDRQLRETTDPVQVVVSNALGLMPMRVAHKLNLTGASCGVQTGCSTSLVAVHMACQSLRSRESDMVLAGGASVGILQKQGYLHQANSILSPDGKCRAFDAGANGTLFGNGVGIVVLRRLSDAIADGDTIYATIQATAINNDGAQKVSLTAPSVSGQAAVVAAALQQAGIEPTAISYLETHGTGTPIGDPIEIAALQKVYGQSEQPYCAIGSVKTNVGHLDAAAGVTGLIKTALMLHHQKLLPSLNFQTINPQINHDRSPFYVNTRLQDWFTSETTRYAAVSSFGMGGTNAHAILAAAPLKNPTPESTDRPQIIPITAKTPTALKTLCQRLKDYLVEHPTDLNDLAYTLQTGRKPLDYRWIIVAENAAQAISQLEPIQPHKVTETMPIAFLFSGQGSQYTGMAQALYHEEPVFREWLDRGFAYLESNLQLDLKSVLYPTTAGTNPTQLNQTQYSQPAIFLVEYSLAQMLMNWGIQPQTMLGHSIGEYVAAAIAGVFDFETGLHLTALRGKFMQECEPGVMLSVSQSTDAIQSFLPPHSYVAVVNAPNLCVVSGSVTAIAQLETTLEQQTIAHRRLQTSHAFHSPMMQAAADRLRQHLATLTLNPPTQPWISNLTGDWIEAEQVMQPDYWIQHLLSPVQFAKGLALLQQTPHILVEVGPSTTLCSLAKQNGITTPIIPVSRHPQDNQSDQSAIAKAISQLWQQGTKINWQAYSSAHPRQRIPLPTYPFEHQSYWVELKTAEVEPINSPTHKNDLADWFYLPTWQQSPILQFAPSDAATPTWQIYSPDAAIVGQWQTQFKASNFNLHPFNLEQHPDYLLIDFGNSSIDPSQILELLQTIAQKQQSIALYFITHAAQSVIGNEQLNPNQAMLNGFAQVMTQEHPQITCHMIDTDRQSDHAVLAELHCAALIEERFTTVAYRYAQRWQQQFRPTQLTEPAYPQIKAPSIGGLGATYIIAGEMIDSLCLSYAKWLGQTHAAKILLLGNTDLPAIAQWETWLATHGEQNHISQWIQALQALQISGVDLQFIPVDLTHCNAVTHCISAHADSIQGVIYTGTMGDRNSHLITQLTPELLNQQITHKIQSIQHLHQALKNHQPDFYLIQSSLAAIVGGLGFAAYAAAHHAIDTFVQQQAQVDTTTRWISINWDAVQIGDRLTTNSTWLTNAITEAEVGELNDRILAYNLPSQIIISPTPIADRLIESQAVTPAAQLTQYDRPQVSSTYIAPRTPTETRIAELMQTLLGITEIGVEDNFFELGGHSLLAIQAVSQLREEFQVDIPMRQFLFESPTVAGIAKIVESHQTSTQLDLAEQLLEQLENQP